MSEKISIEQAIADLKAQLGEKLGVKGEDFGVALGRARHRLPRRIYRQGLVLAQGEPLAGHPKLRLTLDAPALNAAATELRTYLESIDLADKRKGWWLGMLGGLSFNLMLMCALLVAVLFWRGFL